LGEFGRVHDRLREAEALAEASGDRRRLALARAHLANYLRGTVDHRRAVETGERAIADADELGDLTIRLVASDVVAQSYHEMGEFPSAIALLRSNIAVLAGDRALESFGQQVAPAVNSRTVLAWCLSWQGNFAEAFEVLEEGRRVAETAGVPSTIGTNCVGGLAYVIKGDLAEAVPRLQRAIEIYRANSLRMGATTTSAFLGHAHTLAGRTEEAIALLEESLKGAAAVKFRPCTSLWTGWQAGAYLQAGRLTDAKQAGTRALELARAHRERGFEGYALRQLGEIAAGRDPPDFGEAEAFYRDALDIAEELGMRPLQAHCHLGLGKLYRRAVRDHEARAELNVAIDLYLSMDMAHWLPEAEGELAQLA
jgi:tetratricopeptide (TPR) repeat protein